MPGKPSKAARNGTSPLRRLAAGKSLATRRRRREEQHDCDGHGTCSSTLAARYERAEKSSTMYYYPSSDETALRLRLAQAIDDLHLRHCWFAYIPSRLGYNAAVDAAADALFHAHSYYRHGRSNAVALRAALRSYGRCLQFVKSGIASKSQRCTDHLILAIALLTQYEVLMRNDRQAYATHWSAVGALLRGRPRSHDTSELVRAMFYSMWDQVFRVPCTQGMMSPFEEERWLGLEPAAIVVLSDDVIRLRKLSQELLLRLPRLIVTVRGVLGNTIDDSLILRLLAELSGSFDHCRDDEAENALLYSVKVRPTKDAVDKVVVPYSLEFCQDGDLTAAILYWQSRLMLINLCLKLANNLPSQIAQSADFVKGGALHAEQGRLSANILMSWSDASARGDFGTVTMTQALMAVWTAMAHRATFRHVPIATVRDWVLLRFHDSLAKEPSATAARQLSAVSEQLAGGPVADWGDLMGVEVNNVADRPSEQDHTRPESIISVRVGVHTLEGNTRPTGEGAAITRHASVPES